MFVPSEPAMATSTYIAECFWPDLRDDDVERRGDRLRAAAAELSLNGGNVELTGSIVLPEDEVVFYLFQAPSAELVRLACDRARLRFERVIESVRSES
jgi:hypothetical protein